MEINDQTKSLIKLVEKRASDSNSWAQAQRLIAEGADIRAATANGSMINSVIDESKRCQQTTLWKAENCQRLIQVLKNHASELLSTSVFSFDDADLNDMSILVQLHASCYQAEKFGSLGLLGGLLKQTTNPIRLDVVQFLVENDPYAQFGLTLVNDQQETCLSLAKKNPQCSKNVTTYLQRQFDMILNKIPFTQPDIDLNEVIGWIRRGANTEAIDEHRNTVLSNAVLNNNLEFTRFLVGAGCNTSHVNNDGLTPLQIAQNATPRNAQLVAVLSAQNINNELKRLIETKKSHLTSNEVIALLNKGAIINSPITNNNSFLHLLISNKGTPEMITAFVEEFNADISAINFDGHRPIETCILSDKSPFSVLRAFFKLSKVSTDTFFNTKLNQSLLQFSVEQNHSEAKKIIQEELNIRLWNCVLLANTKDDHNQSLILEMKHLVEYGAKIDHKHTDNEFEGWTILHLACKTTTKLFVQYIIEELQANFTLPNSKGDYSISIAAEYGNLLIVQYLHDIRHLPLNISNRDKQTPLHLATKNHHLLVVRYLVLWGADHQARNSAQQRPLDIARANSSKKKEDNLNDKKLINFLRQLIDPTVDKTGKQQRRSKILNVDLDTCELINPIPIEPISITNDDDEGKLGKQNQGFFAGNPNDDLHDAAKTGAVFEAKQAISKGADIRYQKNGRTPYQVTQKAANDFRFKINSAPTSQMRENFQMMMQNCQQIAEDIRQIARTKLTEAILNSDTSRAVAYLQAGAPLTSDLLFFICNTTDNVQLVDYIINQSAEIYQAMINYTTSSSPYHLAKKNKLNKVASYIKYRLSLECTKCIQQNNLEYTKQLIRAGASVDMHDTNNLYEALKHENVEMVKILCQHGGKIPVEWLQSSTIVIPQATAEQMNIDMVLIINHCLVNRRLRLAAANGDLQTLFQCQRLGADINSENCYGSTALLCSIQFGDYFSIVHTLVSCGATMLHSNEDESMSLIAIAKEKKYDQIANYLSQELNVQFLDMILNNDRVRATKFEALGADFNYQDEQKRTALHYAVQFHGIDFVTWLCDRGSTPTTADVNGDYPIITATEKGDYAVVELFVTKYPATKKQTNKAGITALQIAEKQGFRRIAHLLETGKAAPESLVDEAVEADGIKHTDEELKRAAQNGHVKIIKEFCEQRYDSREDKRKLCYELIQIAKNAKQYQAADILRSYYDQHLKNEIPSDIEAGSVVRLNEHYKKILYGFLTGLSGIIADSPIVLDPADPNTYKELFSNLSSSVEKSSTELHQVESDQDAKKLSSEDMEKVNQKLAKITEEMEKLTESKESIEARVQGINQQLSKETKISATERLEMFDQQEALKKQLATFECSMFLFQRQQEAVLNRRNTIEFIKGSPNLYLFYRTIENRMEALFHSALAVQGGYVKRSMKTKYSVGTAVVGAITAENIPFLGTLASPIRMVLSTVISKLDEREQKKEIYNISTLGNIEELGRIASDTAGLLTLYYREQIELINLSGKIKGSNVFNDKISWVKTMLIDVRPEEANEKAVIYVADYIVAWIINALKEGKTAIDPTEPLPQQLWLAVVKTNTVDKGKVATLTDVVGASTGRQMIPLKSMDNTGKEIKTQLRYLIGCVSVVGNDGSVYQYPMTKDNIVPDHEDLVIYGYVYINPFSLDDKIFQSIINGRKLVLAKRKKDGNFITRFDDIVQAAQTYQNHGTDLTSKSVVAVETTRQVAQILREQRYFVDPKDVRAELEKSRYKMQFSIDVLREDIQKKTIYYQTSIEAANEKMKQDFGHYRELLNKDNEERYSNASKKFSEQLKATETRLVKRIEQGMNQLSEIITAKLVEFQNIVEAGKVESGKAVSQANQAVQIIKQSAQQVTQAAEHVQQLVESTEQRRQQLQTTANKCENNVKQTVSELKELFERNISEIRAKTQQELERSKLAAENSVTSAKQAEKAAQHSATTARDVQNSTKEQLNLQKKTIDKLVTEVKEIGKKNERLTEEAKEANRQAKQAANAAISAYEKINSAPINLGNALVTNDDFSV